MESTVIILFLEKLRLLNPLLLFINKDIINSSKINPFTEGVELSIICIKLLNFAIYSLNLILFKSIKSSN